MTLELEAGKVIGLVGTPGFGLTRLGLGLLRDQPGWVACVDVRGWLSPVALWEVGVSADRVVVVRCSDPRRWPQVTAALVEGMQAVYAEIPPGVATPMLRRLGALARARSTPVVLRPVEGDIPAGITHLRLEAQEIVWEGVEQGRGRLRDRRFTLVATGKGVGGIRHILEVEDDGTDTVRVVSRLAAAMPERIAG
jgi:hypothetical protein